MPRPATDSTVPERNLREIRLGLVCYGGVSLAIYMHGMTKELQKLIEGLEKKVESLLDGPPGAARQESLSQCLDWEGPSPLA